MLRLLVVLTLYGAVFLVEGIPLIRRRDWRTLLIFTGLCLLGLALAIPWSFGRHLSFPSQALMEFFEPLAQKVLGPPE
ncbi:hypothetical protein [Thermanaeromonas sp. C210]|uniref:hypothetical protein n=1 Tax=Thermanaeromonas sp. C210 TaxID=2731925 RepID=UPI00155CD6F3|nr:hypothetical protein [Thermanaeromonas sp. C210]GFN24200.1 hypothetical protein TAMC210_25180 [Thermanaeromonas sp. C210]